MKFNWSDKRREFRFLLKGSLEGFDFAMGTHNIAVEPIDISRSGMGVIVDAHLSQEDEYDLKINFPDKRPPVTLHVRFRTSEREAQTLNRKTRCGLELSDKDKRRGIDLIALLSGTPKLRLLCAS